MIEERRDTTPVFEAVLEAMSTLREIADGSPPGFDIFEAEREAWMRMTIRAAEKKYQRIAVICGAWHLPALAEMNEAALTVI